MNEETENSLAMSATYYQRFEISNKEVWDIDKQSDAEFEAGGADGEGGGGSESGRCGHDPS